ncbi:Prohibitins and stomatins of the pid superfamily [Paragonimus heterotremus]|uniref:Prohibitins and stomatins of the pid superfamily n=1 Tax=Paragonimus heterotremus TaxID=100268 RepID=A0A8J4TCJ1_9TREM|nr:Prohibitins and stomatins of the pid superfamily [Paragonimus heterotremus]
MPSVSFASDTRTGQKVDNGGDKSTSRNGGQLDGNTSDSESGRICRNGGGDRANVSPQLRVPTAMPSLARGFSLVPERLGKRGSYKKQGNKGMFGCEAAMQLLAYLAALLTLPFSLFMCLKVIAQYERAVVFRLGRLVSEIPKGPGLVFVLPCLDNVKTIDLRTFTFNVPTQEVLTKDSVTVAVDAVVYYRIFDPVMSVVNVEDANRSTRLLAQTTLRNVLGTVDLYQLLTAREQIAHLMQDCLDTATETWGVKVERVDIKDVRLPIQLQRAMAAEAEAAREAKAKVIAAEGEQRASVALKAAAMEIGECPIALQLRYLQTLSSISDEKNSTIIFPLPIDLLSLFHQKFSGNEGSSSSRMDSSHSCSSQDENKRTTGPPPPPPREAQQQRPPTPRQYIAPQKLESAEEDLI